MIKHTRGVLGKVKLTIFLSFILAVWEGAAGEARSLRDLPAVAALQDQAQLTLNKYITTAYPTQPFR